MEILCRRRRRTILDCGRRAHGPRTASEEGCGQVDGAAGMRIAAVEDGQFAFHAAGETCKISECQGRASRGHRKVRLHRREQHRFEMPGYVQDTRGMRKRQDLVPPSRQTDPRAPLPVESGNVFQFLRHLNESCASPAGATFDKQDVEGELGLNRCRWRKGRGKAELSCPAHGTGASTGSV